MNPYFQRYNGCGPCRPWCYDTSQNSTAFSSCSRNRGFSRGAAIDHVLPANKTTGSRKYSIECLFRTQVCLCHSVENTVLIVNVNVKILRGISLPDLYRKETREEGGVFRDGCLQVPCE